MNKEELLYNEIYERTKEFGRTQFVRELMRLQRENKELQQKINQLETNIEKAINILEDLRKFVRSEDDYIMGGAEIISELTSTINILKGSDK